MICDWALKVSIVWYRFVIDSVHLSETRIPYSIFGNVLATERMLSKFPEGVLEGSCLLVEMQEIVAPQPPTLLRISTTKLQPRREFEDLMYNLYVNALSYAEYKIIAKLSMGWCVGEADSLKNGDLIADANINLSPSRRNEGKDVVLRQVNGMYLK